MGTVGLVLVIVLGVVLVVALAIYTSVFVVQQGTVIVVKRWGKHYRVYGPGLHFRLVVADKKHRTFSNQRDTLDLQLRGDSGGQLPVEMEVALEVVGETHPETVARLAYEITDPLKHLRTVATATARQMLLTMTFEEILADRELAARLMEALQSVAHECGYQILNARITSVRPEASVQKARIESVEAAERRLNEAAQATHDNSLKVSRATATAEASAIESAAERDRLTELTTRVVAQLDQLLASGMTMQQASEILAAMLYGQAVSGLSGNTNAQIVMLPPGLKLGDSPAGILSMAGAAANGAQSTQ